MTIKTYKTFKILILLLAGTFIAVNTVLITMDAVLVPDLGLVTAREIKADRSDSMFYIDMNMQSGYFNIMDNSSNKIFDSYPSEIETNDDMREPSKNRIRSFLELNLLDTATRTVTAVNSSANSVENGGLSVESTQNGYRLTYSFLGGDIKVPVELYSTGFGFSVVMKPSEITETIETNVLSVNILPFFISQDSKGEKEGYFVIPDGSGSIINFQTKKPANMSYSQKVYSEDLSVQRQTDVVKSLGIRFPVFGSVSDDEIIMGIITKGAADAYVFANTDEERTSYINVCPGFVLRERDKIIYDDNRSEVDIFQKTPILLDEIKVDYYLNTGENLSYVDMAHLYRNYLVSRYGLSQVQSTGKKPLFLDIYGTTVKKRQYLGIPADSVYPLTTYEQLDSIVELLKNADVGNVIIQYNNFTKESAWGNVPGKVTPLFSLGGRKNLKKLIENVFLSGYEIYGAVNISEYHKGSSIFSNIYEPAKNMRKEPVEIFNFKPNTYTIDESQSGRYLIRNSRIVSNVEKYVDNFSVLGMGAGIKGHENLYRDYSNDSTTLEFTMNAAVSAISKFSEKEIPMVTNGGYEYELEYSSGVFNMPSSHSGYDIADSQIPFYQIALHGLIPYSFEPVNSSTDISTLFLKSLETGASLQYLWTYETSDVVRYSRDSDLIYSHFAVWIDEAINRNRELNTILGEVSSNLITGHEKIGEKVFMTTYDNGIKVLVNYGESDFNSDYGIVRSMGYLKPEGGYVR